MKIVLDFQHINKPHKPKSRGASNGPWSEVDLAILYMDQLRQILETDGHEVFFGLCGTYRERASFVNKRIRPDLYLAGHVNAGKGRYGLLEIDSRAGTGTRTIAKCIKKSLKKFLPITQCQIKELSKGARGFICIKDIHCSAILLEPLFIDNKKHLSILIRSPILVARAISNGIMEYVKASK